MNPYCLITGCDMLVEGADGATEFWQHGDLWELVNPDVGVYVFNAVGEPECGTPPPDRPALIIAFSNHANYFERRNVYVVFQGEAYLNSAALAYLARSPL